MQSVIDIPDNVSTVVETDIQSAQYKLNSTFLLSLKIFQQSEQNNNQVHGIAGHVKCKVDHVACVAKVTVRIEVAAGTVFQKSSEIATFFQEKFCNNENPL